jgi:hypothetical protein
MRDEVYENYLRDLGFILKENAEKAKEDLRAATSSEDQSFRSGFRMVYYDVVTIIQQQQIAVHEVTNEDLGFDDFDPDQDVLGP